MKPAETDKAIIKASVLFLLNALEQPLAKKQLVLAFKTLSAEQKHLVVGEMDGLKTAWPFIRATGVTRDAFIDSTANSSMEEMSDVVIAANVLARGLISVFGESAFDTIMPIENRSSKLNANLRFFDYPSLAAAYAEPAPATA